MPIRAPQLRSNLARATVPVGLGIVFFGLLALALWGVAALISDGESSDLLASRRFEPGRTQSYARIVAEDGPIIFPDLLGTDGDKTIVLDHVGDDPDVGWRIYLAHPADRDLACKLTQVRGTREFTDCDRRTVNVDALAPPPAGVGPVVSADGVLSLDLTAAS